MFIKREDTHQVNVKRATENIVPSTQMYKIIDDVFEDLARMIAHTLGPSGGNTLITEPYASTPIYPSKDGFKVMNNHIYTDVTYESIYRIIRDISGRMNEQIGDSTTSGVIIAKAFYKNIRKYLKKHKEITPYGIKNILDSILVILTKLFKEEGYIKNISELERKDKIEIYRKVATIAANNDSSIGDKIAEAFEKSNSEYTFVDIQKSENAETTLETDIGFEMPYGYNMPHMANNSDGITAEYDKPLFLLINGILGPKSLPQVRQWFKWTIEDNRPLVIIAEGFSKEVMDYIILCRTGITRTINGQKALTRLPVLTITFNMSSTYGKGQLDDLEAILGAKALQTNNGSLIVTPSSAPEFFMLLGNADHIESRYSFTRIRGGAGDMAGRRGRIEEIKKLIKLAEDHPQHGGIYKERIAHFKHRIAMLEGEMMIIRVGGDSYKEKENRKLIFDDAYLAVKACRSNGISLGGNVSISNCCKRFKSDIVEYVINDLTNPNVVKNTVVLTSKKDLEKIVSDVVDIIGVSSKAAFIEVFNNATNNKKFIKKVFKDIDTTANLSEDFVSGMASQKKVRPDMISQPVYSTYNIVSNKREYFINSISNLESKDNTVNIDPKNIPSLIVPGNTDYELLRSVFSIVGIFLTSNQLITLLIDRSGNMNQQQI